MAATISKWPSSLSLTISQFVLHIASRTVFPKMQTWSWHPPSSHSSMTPHRHRDKAHSWVWYGGLLVLISLLPPLDSLYHLLCPCSPPCILCTHAPPLSPLIRQHALPSSRNGFPSTPYLHGLANYFLSFQTQHNYHLLGGCFTAGFGSLLSAPQ